MESHELHRGSRDRAVRASDRDHLLRLSRIDDEDRRLTVGDLVTPRQQVLAVADTLGETPESGEPMLRRTPQRSAPGVFPQPGGDIWSPPVPSKAQLRGSPSLRLHATMGMGKMLYRTPSTVTPDLRHVQRQGF